MLAFEYLVRTDEARILAPLGRGVSMATLNGHSDRVWGVAFSPDGKTLASASDDKTVILWNLDRVIDLNKILAYGCDWARDYLKTNPNVTKEDRRLCDDIGTSRSHNTDSKSTATLMLNFQSLQH